ncbi:phosphonate C-P lyase system protein PhnG [Deinococcus sp.]|uniref:phosphonate C-P lyase system protein PhnG n=1 Tax=Deinococcus sp. TaxID=47478 RepID=UPI0025BCA5D9|nr:phosphonate C-P lyase system protein PhnG [Deinococcus sp.]
MSSEFSQSEWLSTLTAAPATEVKTLANTVLPQLAAQGELDVVHNRTGLVMLPYRDTVQGTTFHLGEALVAQGQVQQGDFTGYGVVLGRDLEQALAVALLDLALQQDVAKERIFAFMRDAQAEQRQVTDLLLRKVESTRVQMETF